jgi:predicted RNA-binding Zn ribbon-like protein
LIIVGNPRESGADLAVVLVNTWDTYDDPHEHLVELQDLRDFLRIVGREDAAHSATRRDLGEVRQLRERLRRVFDARKVEEAAKVLNDVAAEAGAVPQLERRGGDWHVRFGPGQRSIAAHLGAVTSAALIEIVQAHGLSRFGSCAAAPCTGAFVDRTKNRSKRYCCELCGDRAAQQHHRARLRA